MNKREELDERHQAPGNGKPLLIPAANRMLTPLS